MRSDGPRHNPLPFLASRTSCLSCHMVSRLQFHQSASASVITSHSLILCLSSTAKTLVINLHHPDNPRDNLPIARDLIKSHRQNFLWLHNVHIMIMIWIRSQISSGHCDKPRCCLGPSLSRCPALTMQMLTCENCSE